MSSTCPPRTILENLQTAYSNMAVQLAAVTANPKPSYSVDGESFSWVEYQNFLIDKMMALKRLIQIEAGPYEVKSRALT